MGEMPGRVVRMILYLINGLPLIAFKMIKMKKIIGLLLLLLCMAPVSDAQTIRNTNYSVVAKIDQDGTVRNSNHSVIAHINSNGVIRDSNHHYLGKIESDGDIRDHNHSYLGKVRAMVRYGTVITLI